MTSPVVAQWWKPSTWFSPPTTDLNYSLEDYTKNSSQQNLALRGEDDLFFIDKGYVFKKNLSSNEITYVSESRNVASLVLYKDLLVAMDDNGIVWLLSEQADEDPVWVQIGNSAIKIIANNRDLITQVENGELWIFKGSLGKVVITYESVSTINYIPCGKHCFQYVSIFIPVPHMNGREVTFYYSGVSNVYHLKLGSDGRIKIKYQDGSMNFYDDLDLLNPPPE